MKEWCWRGFRLTVWSDCSGEMACVVVAIAEVCEGMVLAWFQTHCVE